MAIGNFNGNNEESIPGKIKKAVHSNNLLLIDAVRKYGDKLLFFLALAILVTALLVRQGKSIRDVIAEAVVQNTALELIHWWEDGPEKELLLTLTEQFERTHDKLKVNLTYKPYEELRQALFSPGEFPGDLYIMDLLWVPELIKKEIIISGENTGVYDPMVPIASFINVLYYNINILREAGFSRPPRSRNEFLSYARTIANARRGSGDEVSGVVLAMDGSSSRSIYDNIFPWIWAGGVQLISDGNPAVTSRQVIDSLSFLASLNTDGIISPGILSNPDADKIEDFITGRAAFMIAPTMYIELAKEHLGEDAFGITSVPQPENYAGKPSYAAFAWTLGIMTASPVKEEARLLADFLAGKASLFVERTNAVPLYQTQDPFYSRVWDIIIAGDDAGDFSGLAAEHEFEQIFREELAKLFASQSNAAQTAAAVQARWEALLSGAD